jgi:hypothetical protein
MTENLISYRTMKRDKLQYDLTVAAAFLYVDASLA